MKITPNERRRMRLAKDLAERLSNVWNEEVTPEQAIEFAVIRTWIQNQDDATAVYRAFAVYEEEDVGERRG
jgi:hypothetical protein